MRQLPDGSRRDVLHEDGRARADAEYHLLKRAAKQEREQMSKSETTSTPSTLSSYQKNLFAKRMVLSILATEGVLTGEELLGFINIECHRYSEYVPDFDFVFWFGTTLWEGLETLISCDMVAFIGSPSCEDTRKANIRVTQRGLDLVSAIDKELEKARLPSGDNMSEPKTTDYCAKCGESPESAIHVAGAPEKGHHNYIHPRSVCEFQRFDLSPDLNARPCGECVLCERSEEKRLAELGISKSMAESLISEDFEKSHDYRSYMNFLQQVADSDVAELRKKDKAYGGSWMRRGGVGAYMMAARKMDRLDNIMKSHCNQYDVFDAIEKDEYLHPKERINVIDDIRDLRRYLILIEAKMIADGVVK